MNILVFRALSFLKPEAAKPFAAKKDVIKVQQPDEWFHLQPAQLPQEAPDWIKASQTYSDALKAGYLSEVVLVEPAIKRAATAHRQGVGSQQVEVAPPLAAESRDMSKYGVTGIPVALL